MAVFNPETSAGRDDAPSYIKGYSEPISAIKADESTGLALAAVGKGIEGAATLAEQTAKGIIDEDVRNKIEPIREDYTKQLEGVRAAQNNVIPNAVQTGAGSTAAPTTGGDPNIPVPTAVTSGLDKANSIQEAFNNGKINDTYYTQRLKEAVTGLRSNYPGFVDYIDQKVAGIVGMNPANAYVNNLMQDINRAVSGKKTEYDHVLDIARSQGSKFDGGDKMYFRLLQDPSFMPEYMHWYSQENAKLANYSEQETLLRLKKARGEDTRADEISTFSDFVAGSVDSSLNKLVTLTGTNKPETITNLLRRAQDNPNSFSPEQAEELATRVQAEQKLFSADMKRKAYQQGWVRRIGEDGVNNGIKLADSIFQNLYDPIKGGGPEGAGFAFLQANIYRGMMDKSRVDIARSDLGQAMLNFKIQTDHYGPIIASQFLTPLMLEELGKAPDKVKMTLASRILNITTPPADPASPPTVAKHLAEVSNDQRLNSEDKAFVYKGLNNTVEQLKNKNAPNEAKQGIVTALFSPNNNGNMNYWEMGHKDRSPEGVLVRIYPGRTEIWNQLTDKGVTDAISTMDEKSKGMYRNWLDITGRELIGEDILTLKRITGHDDVSFTWTSNPGGSPYLTVVPPSGPPSAQSSGRLYGGSAAMKTDPAYMAQIKDVVERINKALPNLNYAYQKLGGNAEVSVLQTLQQYGMDFEGKITGLPKAFGDAVAASRKKPIGGNR